MRYLRLVRCYVTASVQNDLAYRANFGISVLHALLNLGTGVLGVWVLFAQVEQVHGWTLPSALALLGVYMVLDALRKLFIGPSLDALAGLGGEIHTGQFDYTLLRPVDAQFMASFRHWRPLALIDLCLGMGVLSAGAFQLEGALAPARLASALIALGAGLTILYALLLAFTALLFWSPALLYTWLFNGILQMARYPVGLYPGWVRLLLTWVVPVGIMTTLPAQALAGELPAGMLAGGVTLALALLVGASVLFRVGLRRYGSASS